MRWTDVDMEGRWVKVDGKTGQRKIPLSKEAVEVLRLAPRQGPCVFPGAIPGKHLVNIDRAWRRLVQDLDLSDGEGRPARIHDIRHSVATDLARRIPVPVLQKILGHSSITTTMRYVHPTDDDVLAAMDVLAAKSS